MILDLFRTSEDGSPRGRLLVAGICGSVQCAGVQHRRARCLGRESSHTRLTADRTCRVLVHSNARRMRQRASIGGRKPANRNGFAPLRSARLGRWRAHCARRLSRRGGRPQVPLPDSENFPMDWLPFLRAHPVRSDSHVGDRRSRRCRNARVCGSENCCRRSADRLPVWHDAYRCPGHADTDGSRTHGSPSGGQSALPVLCSTDTCGGVGLTCGCVVPFRIATHFLANSYTFSERRRGAIGH